MTVTTPAANEPEEVILKRAVIYLRVSTMAQANTDSGSEGFSIEAQREACYRKAATLGAEVIEEFIDKGESAKKADRPALQAMLARLKADDNFDYLIVHKVDRLARNRADDVTINLAIQAAGTQLVSVSENIDETPSGLLLHGIMSSIAEFYSKNLAAEAMKGMNQKAKKGGTPGRAPLGYLNVREMINGKEIRTIAIDPERAPLIQWAFEAYATGDWTTRQLTSALAKKGLTTRPTPKLGGKPVELSHVAALLSRPYYIGLVTFNGVEYVGTHEPLVDVDTYARVQAILAARRNGEKSRQHPHYLKGTIICGRCGSRLSFSRSRGRRGGLYDYFFCLGHQMHRTECQLPYLPVETIERQIVDHYATIHLSEERQNKIRALINQALEHRTAHAKDQTEKQTKRIARLEIERDKVLQAYFNDAIGIDMLKREQDRITRELGETHADLKSAQIEADTIRDNLDKALGMISDVAEAYAEAGPVGRKHWNQAFFDSIGVDIEGQLYTRPTDLMAELLAEDLIERLEQELKNPAETLFGRGSRETSLVGDIGLEPTTSCASCKRSSQLS